MNLFFVVDIFNIYFLENLISMEGILTFIIIVLTYPDYLKKYL